MTVIEGVNIFLDITSSHRCTRVFKLAVYLGMRAYLVVFRRLYICNLLLAEGPSSFIAIVFYKIFIGFPFRSSRNLREK